MSNHVFFLLIGSAVGMTFLSSCQPYADPNDDRFTTNRPPVEVAPSVATDGAELFASNPLVEFQTTGSNPAPIRTLSAGQTLSILQSDGRFSVVRLTDGTVGHINSNDIRQSTSGYSGGQPGGNRLPDQYGNRFGGGPRPDNTSPPTTNPDPQPTTPTSPTTPDPDPDMIDLDNF